MIINDPVAQAEIAAQFAAYEAALMGNDVAALDGFFWQSPHVVRFGTGESLFGHEAIAAFRLARTGGSPQRVLRNTQITAFDQNHGVAVTEFVREDDARLGRQTQMWVRLPQTGWRIVSAHVSFESAAKPKASGAV